MNNSVFSNSQADVFVPDGSSLEEALRCTSHLAIGAHPDDIEIMAFHGVKECYDSDTSCFSGVVCAHGGEGPRSSTHAMLSASEMRVVRRQEQHRAAELGRYGAIIQLDYASTEVKTPKCARLLSDLSRIFAVAAPEIIYTHSLFDGHDTHVAVALAVIEVLRRHPPERHPKQLLGCEVWRDLDWLPPTDKVVLNVGPESALAAQLLAVFESQNAGGRRYDLGTVGRCRANATFLETHQTGQCDAASIAVDLTPLIKPGAPTPVEFVAEKIDRFSLDVRQRVIKFQTS